MATLLPNETAESYGPGVSPGAYEGSGPLLLSPARPESALRLPDPAAENNHLILKAPVPAHLSRPGLGGPVPVLAARFFAAPPGTFDRPVCLTT